MVAAKVDLTLREAGGKYLAALEHLGLDPDCLFWAEDLVAAKMVLVLASTQFDTVCPLELSKTLFRAYRLALTPREISPFSIRLHSPAQSIIKKLAATGAFGEARPAGAAKSIEIPGSGLRVDPDLVYKFRIPPVANQPVVMTQQWQAFTRNIEKMAA